MSTKTKKHHKNAAQKRYILIDYIQLETEIFVALTTAELVSSLSRIEEENRVNIEEEMYRGRIVVYELNGPPRLLKFSDFRVQSKTYTVKKK